MIIQLIQYRIRRSMERRAGAPDLTSPAADDRPRVVVKNDSEEERPRQERGG